MIVIEYGFSFIVKNNHHGHNFRQKGLVSGKQNFVHLLFSNYFEENFAGKFSGKRQCGNF